MCSKSVVFLGDQFRVPLRLGAVWRLKPAARPAWLTHWTAPVGVQVCVRDRLFGRGASPVGLVLRVGRSK